MAKVRVNWGRLPVDRKVSLYAVRNTARNGLYVLAEDERTAMSIAHSAAHVYGTSTISALDYGRWVEEVRVPWGEKLSAHWNAIQVAISQRVQGTLHIDDGDLAIGDEVIRY